MLTVTFKCDDCGFEQIAAPYSSCDNTYCRVNSDGIAEYESLYVGRTPFPSAFESSHRCKECEAKHRAEMSVVTRARDAVAKAEMAERVKGLIADPAAMSARLREMRAHFFLNRQEDYKMIEAMIEAIA
jgi:hypothetical protein